jgi:fructokinase
MKPPKAVCFGEVLWDIFPEEKKIGGAPLNVALRLQRLGIATTMISAVGHDTLGRSILDLLKRHDLGTNIQENHTLSTGTVRVTLDTERNASYEIVAPVAWDAIALTDAMLELVKRADCLVFGSLIMRNAVSSNTLKALINKANFKVFDVNLRPPHYSYEVIERLMHASDLIKFNEEELHEITQALGADAKTLEEQVRYISKRTNSHQICVTKGAKGAVLFHNNQWFYNQGYVVKATDTVGAGDSFLATLLSGILQKKPAQVALDYACAMGALVASKAGANPEVTDHELEMLMN